MPFPTAFLPGDFIQPGSDPNAGFGIRKLNRAQLVALGHAVGAAEFKSRTPDPQARRYEFKRFLSDDLERLEKGEALDGLRSLSELKTLVEGLIYGHLSIKMHDLRTFSFNVPEQLRYMGVLMDRQGRAFGGTDPETLFFSSATPSDYSDLQQNNNQSRPSGDGARHLLLAFKKSFERKSRWDPSKILWMKALDRLFFDENDQNVTIDLRALRSGWRQSGPVNLRTSVTAGADQYSSHYLPIYETDYLARALVALSGSVSETDDALHLTVNQVPVGRIIMPQPGKVAGANALALGAGNLHVELSSVQTTPRINYEQLAPKLASILSITRGNPDPLPRIAEENPFDYPDVIRIPVQQDGFVALQYLNGMGNSGFSQHFLDQMRGFATLKPISIPDQKQPPCLVKAPDAYFFVDKNTTGGAFYVEEFGGQDVGELKLLGYILWSIFDNAATLSNKGNEVKIGDKTVLTHTGQRFEIARDLQCQWPNERVKAATLQRFKGLLDTFDSNLLFGAASSRWLETGFPQSDFQAVQANHAQVDVGPYKWRTCTV
jgi:hypothetical protein